MLGLSFGKLARFVRPYANLNEVMTEAVTRYADDVRNGTYPSKDESYALPAEAADELKITTPAKESPATESRVRKS
jgi:3-methyl-2-oxobutanoate hydroxymethyltransferase